MKRRPSIKQAALKRCAGRCEACGYDAEADIAAMLKAMDGECDRKMAVAIIAAGKGWGDWDGLVGPDDTGRLVCPGCGIYDTGTERTTKKPKALRDAIVAMLGFKNADDAQRGACRVCAQPVKKPRLYYCGSEHARQFSNSMFMTVRDFTILRAKGVCECGCGLDTIALVAERAKLGAAPKFKSRDLRWKLEEIERLVKRLATMQAEAAERAALESILEEWNAPRDRSGLLECDHKIPFESWTGDPIECNAPDNLWALAIPCHRRKTAEEAGRRAKAKRAAARNDKTRRILAGKAGRV